MMQRLLRVVLVFGVLALAGALVNTGTLLADDDDRDNEGRHRPPQTLPQGFESSRFLNVPSRAFMPDRGDRVTVDLPVNVGIIKAPNGDITLYDSGWKQLAYIFDWNTSCCWYGVRDQMKAIGLDPDRVVRIIIGHGHWDHSGQLSEFPNAVLYVQKEE